MPFDVKFLTPPSPSLAQPASSCAALSVALATAQLTEREGGVRAPRHAPDGRGANLGNGPQTERRTVASELSTVRALQIHSRCSSERFSATESGCAQFHV